MKILRMGLAACLAASLSSVAWADTVKVGIIAPFSGPFAHYGKLFKDGAEAYLKKQDGKFAGHDIQIVYRDSGGPNPAGVKTAAQELIVNDKVDYLGGLVFTPNAMAVAPLIQQSKTPTVIFNAATSSITPRSDYFLRTSYTLWQVTQPLAKWAYDKGYKKVITAVMDYAPGVDAEKAFDTEFKKLGGEIVDNIRMPMSTNDFSPFAQRIKASGAQAAYIFLPGGPPNLGFVNAYNQNGLREAGIEFLGTAEMDEFDLQKFGDAAEGLLTAFHYSAAHDSDANRDFEKAMKAQANDALLNYASVGAYDGMHIIHKMVEATDGKKDGAKAIEAIKGYKWESPRGPASIDPESRHITQNVYLRKVERGADGKLKNTEIENFGPHQDYGLQQQ
ncbi:ABC transporter substrate-binding protein [Pusillimonas sp. CC-YST705]|uniref:ABC transporter substrate-binding protein n=1 Tax=Mesopusillimonas faecipullorum TaxID=2755040 RepID=A0ABS8CCA7_9BURK|nr:ABC transporter substrate-binding protein [Mesopusillimonas faecipullorum]MCB5363659.1 ABC transporter substrate-binding protein [Mesopusillimonas faecipullorum]